MTDRRHVENAVLRGEEHTRELLGKFKARFEGEYLDIAGRGLAKALTDGNLSTLADQVKANNPDAYDKFINTFKTNGR